MSGNVDAAEPFSDALAKLISITEAKNKLPETRRIQRLGESFVIVKDSEPVSAMIPFEEYESFLETLDILETEPDIKKKLQKADRRSLRASSRSGRARSRSENDSKG